MKGLRSWVMAGVGFFLGVQVAWAEDVSRYRVYVLDSSLETVIAASGVDSADVKTLHERPAKIQEFGWRAPYVMSEAELADPVRDILFTFYNDALYRIVVNYDRGRTDGLTNEDIVGSVSAVYGEPVVRSARSLPAAALPDAVVLARWDTTASSVTLVRDRYSREFQLILISTASGARASAAIREATRLDGIEGPRRELQQRKKELADASAARDKTRATNKAAFRP